MGCIAIRGSLRSTTPRQKDSHIDGSPNIESNRGRFLSKIHAKKTCGKRNGIIDAVIAPKRPRRFGFCTRTGISARNVWQPGGDPSAARKSLVQFCGFLPELPSLLSITKHLDAKSGLWPARIRAAISPRSASCAMRCTLRPDLSPQHHAKMRCLPRSESSKGTEVDAVAPSAWSRSCARCRCLHPPRELRAMSTVRSASVRLMGLEHRSAKTRSLEPTTAKGYGHTRTDTDAQT